MLHTGEIGSTRASQLRTRLLEDRCYTIWDQIRRFEVDFINLFFRELAFAGANFL